MTLATQSARTLALHAWEVRGLLDGRVSQLRRPMKPQPQESFTQDYGPDGQPTERRSYGWAWQPTPLDMWYELPDKAARRDPLGGVGARVWVKESYSVRRAFRYDKEAETYVPVSGSEETLYRADHVDEPDAAEINWQRAVTMPRSASRLTLEVLSVRPERADRATDADGLACGARYFPDIPLDPWHRPDTRDRWSMDDPKTTGNCMGSPRLALGNWWNYKYGAKDGWTSREWVWVRIVRVVPRAEVSPS